MKHPLKRAPKIWKRASKFLERASEGDASEITRIVLKSPEAHFQKLSRASEGASRMHLPGSSFGASKRGGGGEASGNLDQNYAETELFSQQMPFTSRTSQHNNRMYRAELAQDVQAIYRLYTSRTSSAI
jgi:hypothetical protein